MSSNYVARLEKDGVLAGSAWLISNEYALTAYHCVDRLLASTNLVLKFHNNQKVTVSVTEFHENIDVAILKLCGAVTGVSKCTIQSPNINITPGLAVQVIGHASAEATSYPMGTFFNGVVRNTNMVLARIPEPVFFQIAEVDPDPGSLDNVKGISGGPVLLRDNPTIAVGLVIEGGFSGRIFDSVPVSVIARESAIVSQVLAKPIIALKIDSEGLIEWSSNFPPEMAHKVWSNEAPNIAMNVAMSVEEAAQELVLAILRLSINSNVSEVCVVGVEKWKKIFRRIKPDFQCTFTEPSLLSAHDTFEPPSVKQSYQSAELAETLHTSMDLFLLDAIDQELFKYFEGSKLLQDGEIHYQLKSEMIESWNFWKSTLSSCPEMLRCFLVRLCSHTDNENLAGECLASLGNKVDMDIFCFPILFSLALAATAIELTPSNSVCGNIEIKYPDFDSPNSGHACGVLKADGKSWARVVSNHAWTVPFVVLPSLKEPYFPLAVQFPSMNQASLGVHMTDPGVPPLIITGDAKFLIALETGKTAVYNYYIERKEEIEDFLSRINISNRGIV